MTQNSTTDGPKVWYTASGVTVLQSQDRKALERQLEHSLEWGVHELGAVRIFKGRFEIVEHFTDLLSDPRFLNGAPTVTSWKAPLQEAGAGYNAGPPLELAAAEDRWLAQDTMPETGIFVRAKTPRGIGNVDIFLLTQESLIAWLRSRHGPNPLMEGVILTLLGWC